MSQYPKLSPDAVRSLLSKGRHMARDRHQEGWVQETGKKVKKWKGHYYVYVRLPDGTEKRRHHGPILGLKSEIKKWEAEGKLREIIANASRAPVMRDCTLRWFWENRYLPLKAARWKESSKPKVVRFVANYILRPFGDLSLTSLTRFDLQSHLNSLSEKYSKSVVMKFRVYVKSMLDEATEQKFLKENPARRLENPITRKQSRRVLSEDEIVELLAVLNGRDRLIIRMFLVLGLRPGELFALRRNDRKPGQLCIDESVAEGKCVDPKTLASASNVWLPKSIETELDFWVESMKDHRPEAFIFASERGTPLNLNNFLRRVIKPAAKTARNNIEKEGRELAPGFLEGINHQAFRRTCATHLQRHGSVKDIQSHLRHSTPAMTMGVYVQELPQSVRDAVESLDRRLIEKSTVN